MVDNAYLIFQQRLVMVGFGSIGEGVLPLIFRHINIRPEQITIITAEPRGRHEAEEYGIRFIVRPLLRDDYRTVLGPMLGEGDFLLNVAVEVSSVALIELCQEKGALYLDTCVEPWPGGYTDPNFSPSVKSNYGLRESVLALRSRWSNGPTAVVTHGANPGRKSHLLKQALVNMAADTGMGNVVPANRNDWARLSEALGIKAIHVAERDTQIPERPKLAAEFVNTWSISGFVNEGSQPAELVGRRTAFPGGWTETRFRQSSSNLPAAPRCRHPRPQLDTVGGTVHRIFDSRGKSVSIPDYFSVSEGDTVRYRPTCHYAYHPCDDAVLSLHELQGKNWELQRYHRLITDEIVSGMDELGVLLMGNSKGVYWYGSRLTIEEARRLAPYNNATSLQVTAPVLAGVIWAMENPRRGIVEPDEMDFARILENVRPYLGDVVGVWGDWTPLRDRERLFPEDLDRDDPWQFKNIRVV